MWTIKFALSGNLIVQSKQNTNNLSSGYIIYNHLKSSAKTYTWVQLLLTLKWIQIYILCLFKALGM